MASLRRVEPRSGTASPMPIPRVTGGLCPFGAGEALAHSPLDNRTFVLYDVLMLASASLSPFQSYTSPPAKPPLLYRRFFTAAECKALDSFPAGTALSEINLIRILLTRSFAAATRAPQAVFGRGSAPARRPQAAIAHSDATRHRNLISMLAAFSHAALIIASLVRFQEKYFGLATMGDPALEALAAMDPNDL